MEPDRREFIKLSATAATAAVFGLEYGRLPALAQAAAQVQRPAQALRILILGGTSFLGPHQVRYALERGHTVSIFNRGRTAPRMFPDLFEQVEWLQGDRSSTEERPADLDALRGQSWDAVIDNSGQSVSWARESAELLADSVRHYVYVSSTGVYLPYLTVGITEEVQPVLADDPPRENPSYGVMKSLSEREVQRVFGERAIVVRPSYIVGPGDTSDRFTYWPVRIARGGEILVPGGHDDPVQCIDVRDLTEWMIRLIESNTTGVFNAAGPFPQQASIAQLVYGIRAATTAPVDWVWIDDYDFLVEHRVRAIVPWIMPSGDNLGHTRINYDKAVANGLTHRPLAQTTRNVLEWWASDAVPEERRSAPRFALSAEREAEIIADWRGRG